MCVDVCISHHFLLYSFRIISLISLSLDLLLSSPPFPLILLRYFTSHYFSLPFLNSFFSVFVISSHPFAFHTKYTVSLVDYHIHIFAVVDLLMTKLADLELSHCM
jgi:hypothetical protein